MKIDFTVKEEEFNGYKFQTLWLVFNGKEYKIGTLKDGSKISFINCVHKEFKN